MPFHEAFLGKRLQDLLTLAHAQMKTVYEDAGLSIPVEGSSTLHAIAPGKRRSLTDIARRLGQSHQLIAQRLGKLRNLHLVEPHPDPDDGRRTVYLLTPEGEQEWRRLDALMSELVQVNGALFEEIDCDLVKALDKATAALENTGYRTRFETFTQSLDHAEALS